MQLNKSLIATFILLVAGLGVFIAGPFLFGPEFFIKAPAVAAQNSNCPISNVSGYAWSSNIGWISMSGTARDGSPYGVYLDSSDGSLCGYAWSSNIGWISFDLPSLSDGCLLFPENPKSPAYLDSSDGTIKGWAEAVAGMAGTTCGGPTDSGWDGWIKMSGNASTTGREPYGVKLENNSLTGYAWGSDVIGWINFDGVAVNSGGGGSCEPGTNCPDGQACSADGTCPAPVSGGCSANEQCVPGSCGANGQCIYSCSNGSQCSSGVCAGGICVNSCASNPVQCYPGSCLADGTCSNSCSANSECLSGQCVNGTCTIPGGNGDGDNGGGDPKNIPNVISDIVSQQNNGSVVVFNSSIDSLINTIVFNESGGSIPEQSQTCKDLGLKISWNSAPALNKEVTFTGSSNDSSNISKWVWMFKSNIILPLDTSNIAHTSTVKFISANTGTGNKSAVVLGANYNNGGTNITCYASRILFVGGRTEE